MPNPHKPQGSREAKKASGLLLLLKTRLSWNGIDVNVWQKTPVTEPLK
jgi:hypothetical protein